MKNLVEYINESLLSKAINKKINHYKDEFIEAIKPYMSELKDKKKCPYWHDVIRDLERHDSLAVVLRYNRHILFREIEEIIPVVPNGAKLAEIFNKIDKLEEWKLF